MARAMIDPNNPLTARVYVNRVWHHIFGRGLVRTVDDFGVLGQPPTHPELLDWLAHWFVHEARWSTKKLIRMLVLSSAFAMDSVASSPQTASQDPENALWHRSLVRRLEAESIRDHLLLVSGQMDLEPFGASEKIHLTAFMTGRGRPGASGPLDGSGRRFSKLKDSPTSPTAKLPVWGVHGSPIWTQRSKCSMSRSWRRESGGI